jgi:hypothetical protein
MANHINPVDINTSQSMEIIIPWKPINDIKVIGIVDTISFTEKACDRGCEYPDGEGD